MQEGDKEEITLRVPGGSVFALLLLSIVRACRGTQSHFQACNTGCQRCQNLKADPCLLVPCWHCFSSRVMGVRKLAVQRGRREKWMMMFLHSSKQTYCLNIMGSWVHIAASVNEFRLPQFLFLFNICTPESAPYTWRLWSKLTLPSQILNGYTNLVLCSLWCSEMLFMFFCLPEVCCCRRMSVSLKHCIITNWPLQVGQH